MKVILAILDLNTTLFLAFPISSLILLYLFPAPLAPLAPPVLIFVEVKQFKTFASPDFGSLRPSSQELRRDPRHVGHDELQLRRRHPAGSRRKRSVSFICVSIILLYQ